MAANPAPNDTKPDDPKTGEAPTLAKREKRTLGLISFFGALTFMAGVAISAYAFVNYRYEATPKGESQQITFEVPRGSGLSSISSRLEEDGIIKSAFLFKLVTKLRGNERNFKAGEFLLSSPASMSEIYNKLSEGKAVLYPFTAPEGLTSAQILRSFSAVETLSDDKPSVPAEGTLLPETYMTPRGMSYSALLTKMQGAQKEAIDELWESRDKDLPIKTKAEAIILASVVEKETGVTSERDVVAGVFINRLRKGMRLQSDPTIIYGISKGEILRNSKGKQRGIRRSEIDRPTAWNTYQIDGLPKTPICNPGKDAIAAVLKPADTEYLFFVADGTGGHVFAKTNREHVNNVKKWRKIERRKKQK